MVDGYHYEQNRPAHLAGNLNRDLLLLHRQGGVQQTAGRQRTEGEPGAGRAGARDRGGRRGGG